VKRFGQRDPMGALLHAYAYVEDEPLTMVDAWGLKGSKKDLAKCLDKAKRHLYFCLSVSLACISLAEDLAIIGCVLAGPEFVVPCLTAVGLVLETPVIAAIVGCATEYWHERKDCYREYGSSTRPLGASAPSSGALSVLRVSLP